MSYTLDTVINRKNTHSLKYDCAAERGKPEDILPFWVADMDFKTAQPVLDALEKSVRHGIFGYTESGIPYVRALRSWYMSYFGWEIKPEWLVKTPGVVFAICTAIRALTHLGDAVLIQPPVYYPFSESIRANHRKLVTSPLILKNEHYEMDWEDLEKKISENDVKMCILCSPHNPVGRVWTEKELDRFSSICRKYSVRVIADEIHGDFTYPGHRQTVFASLRHGEEDFTITCTAPSKTFNLAGLQDSNIWIPNETLRRAFQEEMVRAGYSQLNTMAVVAGEAAYSAGRPWLENVKNYLKENLDFTRKYLTEHIPGIKLVEPDGTYLIWLDFRSFGLTDEDLEKELVYKANLWMDMGILFGPEGSGFVRMKIACPRQTLGQGLEQMRKVVGR